MFLLTGGDNETSQQAKGTFTVKAGLAQMLKGGIIMDVINASQARIAEEAGACAVMALEKVPADIRRDGGVARMADPKVRVGEARIQCNWKKTPHCQLFAIKPHP